ncbi:MBL fold metallo-hydrolase [Paenibacillus xerothermodurans]|uniref:MBL fold metallo-hydrolase n=1 Tax=Paenibacillus xerothermodurans TaxID=1977292 RepID=A0A2W1N5K8_PAEXE|nr:MBL fold metallo-hydrolase [Paenibacillus xerothermodurans]PZE19667.1 MBL fold metallo-hydrolase [Paenibacillus xerothermodurans]
MRRNARKRYRNLDNIKNKKTWLDLAKWTRYRPNRRYKRKEWMLRVPQTHQVEKAFLRSNRNETTISWIGHSTFLVQIGGLNIVTDPVWANLMGFGKRLTPPGIALSDMPPVDIVLISHGHYDHLHFPSLRRLPGNPLFLIPEGLQSLFYKKGLQRVEQCSWWERKKWGDVEFVFVPAQHWSKRTLWDRDTSHWGGWVIRKRSTEPGGYVTIYFAGDSGYFRGFREIGRRFDIDYALLPIGAFKPEWFNHLEHVSPEQAVRAYLDLGASAFIPMHYGTFKLADDTPKEAVDRLLSEWQRLDLDESNLKLLKLGQTLRCRQLR